VFAYIREKKAQELAKKLLEEEEKRVESERKGKFERKQSIQSINFKRPVILVETLFEKGASSASENGSESQMDLLIQKKQTNRLQKKLLVKAQSMAVINFSRDLPRSNAASPLIVVDEI